jgi:RecA/RadA recombinase
MRYANGHVKIKCHSSYEVTAHRTQLSAVIGLTSFTSCVYKFYATSFCDVRKCDPNERTTNKLRFALAKTHRSRGDLARVKTVNVVKNRWLPSLRSAAIKIFIKLC